MGNARTSKMIEIKNIVFTKKISFMKYFICFINHLLPLRLKYASETFVALIDKNEKGEITLEKDSKSNTRFKITKLIVNIPTDYNDFKMSESMISVQDEEGIVSSSDILKVLQSSSNGQIKENEELLACLPVMFQVLR